MVKDEKKEIEPILLSNTFNVPNFRVLKHFDTWRLDIVFLKWFLSCFVPKYSKKCLKEFITQKLILPKIY